MKLLLQCLHNSKAVARSALKFDVGAPSASMLERIHRDLNCYNHKFLDRGVLEEKWSAERALNMVEGPKALS